VIAIVLFAPGGAPPIVNRPLYETEIKPNEKKIIWYNFNQTVPNLPAMKKIGTAKNPQGRVVSPQIVIATSKDAKKSQQFIWQPTPQKIEEEIKAPNVVSVKPNATTAEPDQKKITAPAPAPPPPAVAEAKPDTPKVDEVVAVVKKPRRRFQPTPQPVEPKLPMEAPPITEAPPTGSVLGGAAPPEVQSTALNQLKIPPKRYVPPKASKTGAGTGTDSSKPGPIVAPAPELSSVGNVNMAIVGLHPSDLPPPTIPGSLPGQFSTAPKAGKASTGNLPISATGIPNLVVEGGTRVRSGSAESASAPGKTMLYKSVITGPMPSTLSAPLHPGTRTIPGPLEARFAGVDVYSMVLPVPNLPGYAGDWVLWFADRQGAPGASVQMRAPVPLKKTLSGQGSAAPGNPVIRVQVAGTVGKDGRLGQVTIIKGGGPAANAVLEDLKAWEFAPATRNQVPVDVEVVIEIPFRLTVNAER